MHSVAPISATSFECSTNAGLPAVSEDREQDGDRNAAAKQQHNLQQSRRVERQRGQYGQDDIGQKHARRNLQRGQSGVRRLLVEVRAMSLRDRFATEEAPNERDRRVRQIIERQQQRGGQMMFGENDQQPADQQPD